jgi:hypothetical protein
MSIANMKEYIKDKYHGSDTVRGKKLDDMTETQIVAIYMRLIRRAS